MLALPKTRYEAAVLGTNHYFAGETCQKGHVSARSTKRNACYECLAIAQRKYRSVNAARIKERTGKYRVENYEQVITREREYAQANREKGQVKSKKYRLNNVENIKDYNHQFRLDNPERVKAREVKYRLENPEKIKSTRRKCTLNMPVSYISSLLGVPTKQLTPEITELKRLHIQLLRAIKES